MLVLSRRAGESLILGDQIRIKVLEIHGHQARLGIEAPASVAVVREELHRAVAAVNRGAVRDGGTLPEGIADRLRGRSDEGGAQ